MLVSLLASERVSSQIKRWDKRTYLMSVIIVMMMMMLVSQRGAITRMEGSNDDEQTLCSAESGPIVLGLGGLGLLFPTQGWSAVNLHQCCIDILHGICVK